MVAMSLCPPARVSERSPAASSTCTKRSYGRYPTTSRLQRGPVRDRGADDLEMAELFGGDVHEQVVLVRIGLPCSKCLHEVLHGGLQLPIAAAELLQQETGEARVGTRDAGVDCSSLT
jgi:hypothetical protein